MARYSLDAGKVSLGLLQNVAGLVLMFGFATLYSQSVYTLALMCCCLGGLLIGQLWFALRFFVETSDSGIVVNDPRHGRRVVPHSDIEKIEEFAGGPLASLFGEYLRIHVRGQNAIQIPHYLERYDDLRGELASWRTVESAEHSVVGLLGLVTLVLAALAGIYVVDNARDLVMLAVGGAVAASSIFTLFYFARKASQ